MTFGVYSDQTEPRNSLESILNQIFILLIIFFEDEKMPKICGATIFEKKKERKKESERKKERKNERKKEREKERLRERNGA